MYSDNHFLLHFLLILKPATLFQCLPFKWNNKSNQIEYAFTSNSTLQRKLYKLKCNFHVACTLTIMAQVALNSSQNPSIKTMCTFTVAMLTLTTVVVKEYSNMEYDAVSLLTRFISSSRCISGVPMDRYERSRKFAVDLLNPGTFLFPLLYTVGVAWRTPCIPSNFGYYLVQECSDISVNAWLALVLKFLFACVNFWIWSFGMHATVVVGSGIVWFGALHFRCRLIDYRRKMLQIKSGREKQAYSFALIYRQIQLLSRQYNLLHQRILVVLIMAVVSTQSICIYALIEFQSLMHWLIKVFFAMMGFDCFVSIIMLCGTLADAYDESVKVLKIMRRKHRGCKWLYRFHMSCQTIKMRFGLTNFMEKLTPLNFQNFSLCQTVNLLLMK